jgi:hypothetical protein
MTLVRIAEFFDLHRVTQLMNRSLREQKLTGYYTVADAAQLWQYALIFLVVHDGKIIGYAQGTKLETSVYPRTRLLIEDVFIEKPYRRYAYHLYRFLYRRCVAHRIECIDAVRNTPVPKGERGLWSTVAVITRRTVKWEAL